MSKIIEARMTLSHERQEDAELIAAAMEAWITAWAESLVVWGVEILEETA